MKVQTQAIKTCPGMTVCTNTMIHCKCTRHVQYEWAMSWRVYTYVQRNLSEIIILMTSLRDCLLQENRLYTQIDSLQGPPLYKDQLFIL